MSRPVIAIRKSKMSPAMQREALQVALLAVNMYTEGKDIAVYMKKEFDRKHGHSWHCIMGNFCSSVTHSANSYISFSVGTERMVLFKTD